MQFRACSRSHCGAIGKLSAAETTGKQRILICVHSRLFAASSPSLTRLPCRATRPVTSEWMDFDFLYGLRASDPLTLISRSENDYITAEHPPQGVSWQGGETRYSSTRWCRNARQVWCRCLAGKRAGGTPAPQTGRRSSFVIACFFLRSVIQKVKGPFMVQISYNSNLPFSRD